MGELTELERVILQLVERGDGKWGWYKIATRLSSLDVPRDPDLMTVLKTLVVKGLVNRSTTEGSPHDQWELTESGKAAIAPPRSSPRE
jgi:PadR family transcriptional regulator PadR